MSIAVYPFGALYLRYLHGLAEIIVKFHVVPVYNKKLITGLNILIHQFSI